MKCPRCQHDLKRKQVKPHKFVYTCPICGLTIGSKREQEEPMEDKES